MIKDVQYSMYNIAINKGKQMLKFTSLNKSNIKLFNSNVGLMFVFFTGSFSDLTSLTELRLDDNNLATVPEGVFNVSNHPSNLNQFRFYGNPLMCNQLMCWVHQADGEFK